MKSLILEVTETENGTAQEIKSHGFSKPEMIGILEVAKHSILLKMQETAEQLNNQSDNE